MAGNYRNVCGECDFRTSWTTESAAQDAMYQHYLTEHPTVQPGGIVQFQSPPESSGGVPPIVWIVIAVIVLCVLITQCQ